MIRPVQALRWLGVAAGLFGAALIYGDGAVTPAISVLSALEGLNVVTHAFTPFILQAAVVILAGLFAAQSLGTAKIGRAFGPIMLVWFAVIFMLGARSLVAAPQVLVALSPHVALEFAARHGIVAFIALGAVTLAITGAEALYADMGHFGPRPIRLAWSVLVLPALLANYYGQGALLLADPKALENPFFLLAPDWMLYPMVVLATVATVIASQATISGAFSMAQQAALLGLSPRVRITHTSASEHGQIYVPAINWLQLAGVLALVLAFKSSTNLAAAYGIAVTGTMTIDTLLAFLFARRVAKWSLAASIGLFGAFLVVDLAYLGANLVKIPDGGWFPLGIALAFFVLLTTWKRGRQLLFDGQGLVRVPELGPLRLDGAYDPELLRHVASLVAERGLRVGNVDATIIAQAPRMAPQLLLRLRRSRGHQKSHCATRRPCPESRGRDRRRRARGRSPAAP